MTPSPITSGSTTTTAWGAGDQIPGTPFRQLVTTAETRGAVSVLAVDMPAGEHVDAHTHDGEDQINVVISGTVLVTRGDEELLLTEGSVVFLPRGVPHSLRNVGTEPARLLDLYTPGGFEQRFVDAGRHAPTGGARTSRDVRDGHP